MSNTYVSKAKEALIEFAHALARRPATLDAEYLHLMGDQNEHRRK
ncbi:hypothetical protein [Rhizobium leguminosarum]